MRILYVEDNRLDADLAAIELKRAFGDLELIVATSITEAWACLENPERFDALVADLGLPDGSGLDLVASVREKDLPLALIMLTGSGDERSAVASLKVGVDDYLIKTGDYLQQLPQILESAVAKFRNGLARRSRPLRVLYAEHHSLDIELTRRHIQRHAAHIRIDAVHTADEALARVRQTPQAHDVLLLDYRLVGINALELMQSLSAAGLNQAPVVLVTGQGDEAVAVEALRLGASDYIVKRPGYLHELPATLENAFHRSLLAREQAALRASEASRLLREEALETMPFGVLLGDAERRIIYANPAFTRLTGYHVEDIIGHNCALLQGPDTDPISLAAIHRALSQAQPFEGELINYRKDGSKFWNHLTITPVFGLDGRVSNFIAVQLDVTPQRQAAERLAVSEERFRQIAENIQEVFWMTDPQKNKVLYISPAYETIWGRRCQDIISQPSEWLRAIHPDDQGRVAAATLRQVEGDYDETYRVVRPDGSIRWVRDKAYPIKNEAGEVYRIVGTAEDITEYRQLQTQFLQSQKMEAIGTLAGGIAHDFNNILTAITGYTELVKLQVDNQPRLLEHLNASLQACSRATDLVRQILAFSRQNGTDRKPAQLKHVIQESLTLLRATIPVTIAFETDLADGLPLVLADDTQIHQVMMNLGTNAAQAMKDQFGKLSVRLDLVEITDDLRCQTGRLQRGPHVRLTVTDTGRGMSTETMARIFEPFFTTKAPGQGTGLGLAVVHGVMQTHEGAVIVKSSPDKGASFELYFPAHAQSPAHHPPASPEDEVPRGNGERILFVDDEVPIMMIGRMMLAEMGYRVEAGTDPQAMLTLFKDNPNDFDLVITDLTMPGFSGLDLARTVLELRPGLPVLLTTGYSATLTAEHTRKLGITELLLKPLSMQALGQAIRQALDNQPSGKV